jgi:hypothetical protein
MSGLKAYPTATLVHTPTHVSWLNQVEIYFSIVQRQALTPNDVTNLAEVEERLRLYQALSNSQPRPFAWKVTHTELALRLGRLNTHAITTDQLTRAHLLSEATTGVAAA